MPVNQKPIKEFWRWFEDHLADFDSLLDADEPFWDIALGRLKRIHSDLWFEASYPDNDARELIITVEGREELFPLAEDLVANAPPIRGWRFIALKPAMGFEFQHTYEGVPFDPQAMWFLPLKSDRRPNDIAIRIGIPGLTEENQHRARAAVLVILDTAIGERSASSDIRHVEVTQLPTGADAKGYIKLTELPNYIERKKRVNQPPSYDS